MPFGFSRDRRLRSRAEYLAVQNAGARVSSRHMTLLGRTNTLGTDRLGIVATRKMGGAVQRNRAKRRLRALFRHEVPPGVPDTAAGALDVVVIARRSIVDAAAPELRADFLSAYRRLRRKVRNES